MKTVERPVRGIGERIRVHREAAGVKVGQLASLVGLSRNTIANYEGGRTEPGSADLVRIARALGCSIMDLLEDSPTEEVARFAFRAHAELRRNPEVIAVARMYLQAYREIEEITGTELCPRIPRYDFHPRETPAEPWIRMAAAKAREECALGDFAPENIVQGLENLGIRSLFFLTQARGLDGLSVVRGAMSLVMLHDRKKVIERTIFSAAHELGHLVLHPDLYTTGENVRDNGRDYEREANLFAGHFLVPEEELRLVWKEEALHELPLVHALLILKKIFRVSFWCLYQRADQEGLARTSRPTLVNQVKALLRLPKDKRAKMEDLEPNPLPGESLFRSTRFARLVRSAFIQEKIGVSKVAEMFQETVDRAKEITGEWMGPESVLVE